MPVPVESSGGVETLGGPTLREADRKSAIAAAVEAKRR